MSVTDKDVMIPYDSWFVFGIVFFRWLSQGPSTWRCISSVHRSNGLTFGEPKGTARRWRHCLTGVCWPGLLRCRVVVTHVIWIHGRSLYDRCKYIGWIWIRDFFGKLFAYHHFLSLRHFPAFFSTLLGGNKENLHLACLPMELRPTPTTGTTKGRFCRKAP